MSISEALLATVSADARRARSSHPKGFEPGVRFSIDSGLPESATVSSDVEIKSALDHRKIIEEKTKLTIPEDLEVRLERLTLEDNNGESPARWWYKYVFVPASSVKASAASVDAADVLVRLRKGRKAVRSQYVSESATMGLVWADWQVGKSEGGGTEAFLARFDSAVAQAELRARELKRLNREAGQLVIFANGDIVEGCTIFRNQSWQIDCDTRDQMKYGVTAALEGLDRLAPLFSRVVVLVNGGNHGENRQNGAKVNNHDNRDIELFENVARVAERDPRLGHVEWSIAQNELAKTIDIQGWIFAAHHGQMFDGGSGPIERRAFNWYSRQAAGHLAPGDAHVLISSHYHHRQSADWGACLWQQSGTFDGGSAHFTDKFGTWSNPGMLSFVVTPQSRWQDEQLLS